MIIAKCLIESLLIATADTSQYIAPAGVRTTIDKFTATNTSGAAAVITVNLVASGGAAGTANKTVSSKSLLANETYTFPELVGHVLNAGDFINTSCTVAAVVAVRASGREIS
jgi:hypothetical protein